MLDVTIARCCGVWTTTVSSCRSAAPLMKLLKRIFSRQEFHRCHDAFRKRSYAADAFRGCVLNAAPLRCPFLRPVRVRA